MGWYLFVVYKTCLIPHKLSEIYLVKSVYEYKGPPIEKIIQQKMRLTTIDGVVKNKQWNIV